MMKRKLINFVFTAMVGLAILFVGVIAQAKDLVITPTLSGASWPIFIALDGEYFEKYGLDIDVQYGRHPSGIAGVSSGDAITTNYGLDSALAASSKGKQLVLVGSSLNLGSFVLMGSKGITNVQELANKRIAIGRVGDPPYHYTVALLKALGMSPDDIKWVPAGRSATRVITLKKGGADSALLTAPSYYSLLDSGFPVLVKMAEHPEVVVSQAYVFHRDTLENKPKMVENFMKAVIEATHRFYTDKEFSMESMKRHTSVKDASSLTRVYDEHVTLNQLERIPYIRKHAIDEVIKRNSKRFPALKTLDLSKIVYNNVLDNLADEGFFEKIYGSSITEELQKVRAVAAR